MSGPTKADRERRIQQLERELEIAHEQISDLLDGAKCDQSVIKTTSKSQAATIKKACSLLDTVQVQAHEVKTLAGTVQEQAHEVKTLADKNKNYTKCGPAKTKKAKIKKAHLVKRYGHWLAKGKPYFIARELANNELKEKFNLKKGYGTTMLCELCPQPKD